ncbi:hypothetical protein ACIQKA_29060 [Streptomyces sp. NPDC092045]|uniref:hypothetical protein n=1 Tax=Streptomyces sp. NPDC092045 TaxID=3366008 RepID=UPI003801CC43
MVELGRSHPEPGGGLVRPERDLGGDQVRQVLAPADLLGLAGMVQRAVRVRAQVGQEAAVDEPADHERRHVRRLAVNGPVRSAEGGGDPVGRRAAEETTPVSPSAARKPRSRPTGGGSSSARTPG